MSPLSKDLSGIILPHNHYGNHLGPSGETIDTELELRNFERAGSCLANVWNESIIDGYPVHAVYVTPGQQQLGSVPQKTEAWKSNHVRQSQYLIQVVKCDDTDCCSPLRTNLKSYLGGQFLPAPVKYTKNSTGIVPASRGNDDSGKFIGLSHRLCLRKLDPQYHLQGKYRFPIPFDYYCPSLTDKQLEERIFKELGIYFASKKTQTAHSKMHRRQPQKAVTYFYFDGHDPDTESTSEEDENNEENLFDYDADRMRIIPDLADWYVADFEDV